MADDFAGGHTNPSEPHKTSSTIKARKATAWEWRAATVQGRRIIVIDEVSNDTRSTVKVERNLLVPAVERAAGVIRQSPDIKPSDISAAEPEIGKRFGDQWMNRLIAEAPGTERVHLLSRSFSSLSFCIRFWSELTGLFPETIKKYLYTPSRQHKQTRRGRPCKK